MCTYIPKLNLHYKKTICNHLYKAYTTHTYSTHTRYPYTYTTIHTHTTFQTHTTHYFTNTTFTFTTETKHTSYLLNTDYNLAQTNYTYALYIQTAHEHTVKILYTRTTYTITTHKTCNTRGVVSKSYVLAFLLWNIMHDAVLSLPMHADTKTIGSA